MPPEENLASRAQYPGVNTTDESDRLKAQHNLVVNTLGGLVLCPIDLSRPDFKALDSGTGNGYFLHMLRQQLKYPESATLVGTDVMVYPTDHLDDVNRNAIEFRTQNVLDPWPTELLNKFDFVHQRAVMANVPGQETAADVVRRLIQLVKPGGWIQLVDSEMPIEDILEDDAPGTKFWKTIGAFLKAAGLDPRQGTRLKELLTSAGGVKNIESKSGVLTLGEGCAPGLEEDSSIELHGLREIIGGAIKKMPNAPVTYEGFLSIADEALIEAEQNGIEMYWHAVWAQRVE